MKIDTWLMLIYKVPTEPNRKRLAIWRKIKSLGAVYLQNGVCVLPPIDDHKRQLKILENDIFEMALIRRSLKRLFRASAMNAMRHIRNSLKGVMVSKRKFAARVPQVSLPMPNSRKMTRI